MNLNQISIPSLNLDTSVFFYQNLGFKLTVEARPHYARFLCPYGQSTFSIHKADELLLKNGIWVYFECERLDETVRELINRGVHFEEPPTDKPWLWREARLKDPDNNQLILYHAGNNRTDPPWKVK